MMLYEGGARAELIRPVSFRQGGGPRAIVGVTGGIGSGKSTVTSVLAELGATVADADVIARQVVAPGSPGLSALVEHFGAGILTENGVLDRPALASRVFGDEEALTVLNSITHPLIAETAWQILNGAPKGSLAVYDVPLLVEKGYAQMFDAVIVVDAPVDVRVGRLITRGLTEEDARRRIASQATEAQRRAVASIWIDNTGTTADLEALTQTVARQWLSHDEDTCL